MVSFIRQMSRSKCHRRVFVGVDAITTTVGCGIGEVVSMLSYLLTLWRQ